MTKWIDAAELLLVGVGLLIGFAWHHIYVKPHDEIKHAIVNCMEERGVVWQTAVVGQTDVEAARDVYETCVALTRPDKK